MEFESEARSDLESARAHFRDGVFEPVRQIDPGAHRLLREGIDDRCSFGFDKTRCSYICLPCVNVDADFDGRIERIQHFGGHAIEDVKVGRPGGRRFSAQDLTHCLALSAVGPLVDNRLQVTVPLGDFSWKLANRDPVKPIQLCIVEITFFNMTDTKPLTKTVCRLGPKLTWTAPCTVAIYKLDIANRPLVGSWLVASREGGEFEVES